MEFLVIIISIYGLFAIAHILFQVILGHMNYRKQNYEDSFGHENKTIKSAVLVPVYNEDEKVFESTLRGLQNLKDVDNLRFYIVDDGSTNGHAIRMTYDRLVGSDSRFSFSRTENQGKRMAQREGFEMMLDDGFNADTIVTIDSDTVIAPNGIIELNKSLDQPNIGAVTGNVMVANKDKNILTEIIGYRYWMAFNQERAAQSYFDVVMCCSGPFSAYRAEVFEDVLFQYTNQYFLGKKCTYGDDRHLTNLVLEHGYNVVYNYKAASYTQVPETFKQYIKQQVRWNKSFYREMLWTLKSISNHHWYLLYDLLMQFMLPFMLMFAVVYTFIQALDDWKTVLSYLSVVVLIGLLRVSYAMYRTKNIRFLKFLGYGLLHVFVLVPVRFYAILTINDGKWGTR